MKASFSVTSKSMIASLQMVEVSKLTNKIENYEKQQRNLRNFFTQSKLFVFTCDNAYERLKETFDCINTTDEETKQLQRECVLFDIPIPKFQLIAKCLEDLLKLKQLWDYKHFVDLSIHEWKKTLWKQLDIEGMDLECKRLVKDIRSFDKSIRDWDVFKGLETSLKNMMTSLRAIGSLQNPAIRERHWDQLVQATKVKFLMTDETTFSDLLKLNLHNFEDEVHNIVDKACKELAMEKLLKELNSNWTNMNFNKEVHSRTGCNLLRASEDMIELLEENQVQLQNMMTSKYIGYFYEEISEWQRVLGIVDIVTTLLIDTQRLWCHLESIFIGSDDIRMQLPKESEIFDEANHQFQELMKSISSTANVIGATKADGLAERLEMIQGKLSSCEKALTDYLETKKLLFPRFYFLSSSDLLDILSNGNEPKLVAKHLIKLFDSIARLSFLEEESNTKVAIKMIAKDGEEVDLYDPCICDGQVENWLNNLKTGMRKTLRLELQNAISKYDTMKREEWLFQFPAQVSLAGIQIFFSVELDSVFKAIEDGYEQSMKDYYRTQIGRLNKLITLLLGTLTKGQRQKVMTICTIDVHSRDVVSKMINSKVNTINSFMWKSQLRHIWDKDKEDCLVYICDASFVFQHEYLGNTPRLVITPLTDRCYITLTQSLHLVMGGAPSGPAGTGKTETTKDLGKALGMMVYVFNCSEQMDYKTCGNIFKGLSQTGAWGCFDEFNRITVEVLSVIAVQVKSIQDAIKEDKRVFMFMGIMINLRSTIGYFVTMNPGYAGRAELPENLKVLFRPCAMCAPDLRLICEIMLVAEGFLDARPLSSKFITLYKLCKELLSKQDHYDWGLRAIKSVLVVAGSLKRSDLERPEEQVLMRALRDFNLPKIVAEDCPVFLGLISDLFPNLDVPRKRNQELEKSVKQAAVDMQMQPEEKYTAKVVQLDELLHVRHSAFIVGAAGTGKTVTWKTLQKTYQNLKQKPVCTDLNPKAVSNDELYGVMNPTTREWKDGLFSTIMRDQSNLNGDGPRWIVFDGDIDPMWVESLNTVMDDNKVLTLANNERIALTPEMKLIFEVESLKEATPATVSRAGILYINTSDLNLETIVTSWIEKRENQQEKAQMTILFEKFGPIFLKKRWGTITPVPSISKVQQLCILLDALFVPSNFPADSPPEQFENFFVFAIIWAFGSALLVDGQSDFRQEFSNFFKKQFDHIAEKIGKKTTVFDVWVDPSTGQFVPWDMKIPKFELDTEVPLKTCLVHNSVTVSLGYFLDIMIKYKYPCMFVGQAGSGKTLLVNEKLKNLGDSFVLANIDFNFYDSAETTQRALEKHLEKKTGKNYGPTGNKSLIYFIDDMNMPEVDKYGTTGAHTIIKQHLDYGHWYCRSKLTLKDIHNCQYLSCMNPKSGSFTISRRLQRHFATYTVVIPCEESLFAIYKSILSSHLENPINKFSVGVQNLASIFVAATVQLHIRCSQVFIPSATKFHYIFNMRDLSNVFTCVLFCNSDVIPVPRDFMRLWAHETERVYKDKLCDMNDVAIFQKTQNDCIRKNFEEIDDQIKQPLIFCHFARGMGENKYSQVTEWNELHRLLSDCLRGYNELNVVMDLVLFEDAMMHICRINRILETPQQNALLIGVGGSGKQSLSRLAAYISSMEVFQINIRKGYSIQDLKQDICSLYQKAGLKNLACVFLISDAQVIDEKFLVLINTFLASGEVPDLFTDDQVEEIISTVKSDVKSDGINDTRENCWKYFIDRVKKQLKVVLCFSPVRNVLRIRARKFPAIVNCTSIDWFHEWPHQALLSVSKTFLKDSEAIPGNILESVSELMAFVHDSTNQSSKNYEITDKKHNYTTPKSYLELINLYMKMLSEQTNDMKNKIKRLEAGLLKLHKTKELVDDLKTELAAQEIELDKKNAEADALIAKVGVETKNVSHQKSAADEEKIKVDQINTEVKAKQEDCERDLLKAEPALVAAQEALNTLNKANLTELKSFGSPPPAVLMVMDAVMILIEGRKGKIPKDKSWNKVKAMMNKVDQFLDSLVNYEKDNIHQNILTAIEPYLRNPHFDPGFVKSKSEAAAGLCSWVINVIKYYEVYCDVEPKRRALKEANEQLEEAQSKLEGIIETVNGLEETLANLTKQYESAIEDKVKCQEAADKTNKEISLAKRLMNGLASENIRWTKSVECLNNQADTLVGDVLMVASFISYLGFFTRPYRIELVEKKWIPYGKRCKVPVPMSYTGDNVNMLSLLTDDAIIAKWNNEGLPIDSMSTENAMILSHCIKWPLMVDPQLQGIKWIKNKYGANLKIIQLGHKQYLETIMHCISEGLPLLIENLPEDIDPVLDPLLARQLIKKGSAIKFGDKEVEYNSNFYLYLHTKLSNPHFKPEIQALTTLIDFTVTRTGLEDQLLAKVVRADRPDLQLQKSESTHQQNEYKIVLKKLEDDLLQLLNSVAVENIFKDTKLVENLESSKKTAAEIEQKVADAKKASLEIDKAREIYRYSASRASLLYFILNDLHRIHPMYQFSLKAFSVVFDKAILKAKKDEDVVVRVRNLTDSITYQLFNYTKRGLFECDKLIFTVQMTFQILLMNKEIEPNELDFLLRFPSQPNVTSPVDFISNLGWGGIKVLSTFDAFRKLDIDIEKNYIRWKKFIESDTPEKGKFPQEWKKKNSLQKLCMLRAMRPDRISYAVINYVEEKIGSKYVESRMIPFSESYEESRSSTPVFFILSPGVDPLHDVEVLGRKMNYSENLGNLHSISLGQGQEVVAEKAMLKAQKDGHWVILQNIHLVKRWLPKLEKMICEEQEDNHPNYRLFVSSDPATSRENHIIPQAILEASIKITNEPPSGIFDNMTKAFDNFNQETLEACSKETEFKSILFSLCYFHAVVSERAKFGPQGWNKKYPFNTGDLMISYNVLYNYLEANNQVPWDDLRYLFGEIMYGGHITDDWDRRLCQVYLQEYITPGLLDGDYLMAPNFYSPQNTDYIGYQNYIKEKLPRESPQLYGLHTNAEIGFLTTNAENLFKTVFELQPREFDNNASSGFSKEEKVKTIVDDIMEKMPDQFNIDELSSRCEDLTPYTVVYLQECERLNQLTKEMKRSLKELDLGLRGELTITSDMEDIITYLFLDQVKYHLP